jgi:hypothetical protein
MAKIEVKSEKVPKKATGYFFSKGEDLLFSGIVRIEKVAYLLCFLLFILFYRGATENECIDI